MKILGCVIILIASILCAFKYEKAIKEKVTNIEELINFINYIKNQIEYFSRPLTEIYLSYEKKSKFIEEIIDGAERTDTSSPINKTVSEFFSSIGKGYKKEEIKLCDYTIEQLYTYLTSLKLEMPNKIKVFRSISLFIGVCTIILLI